MPVPRDPRFREIDEEVEAHLRARIDHLVASGRTPEQARAEALARFGDLDAGLGRLRRQASRVSRHARVRSAIEGHVGDVRYAGRSLARSPAVVLGIVAVVTLGIGVNAAVFRVADYVLLRPPAGVLEPDGIWQVTARVPGVPDGPASDSFSYPDAHVVAGAGLFEAATVATGPRLIEGLDGRRVSIAYVDDRFFRLLGVTPAVGRFFAFNEGQPGADLPVAVVSDRYWRQQLQARPLDPGLTVEFTQGRYRVVGVTSPPFAGIDLDPTDVWLPLGVAQLGRTIINGVVIPWYQSDMMRGVRVYGRLSGTSHAAAEAAASAALANRDRDQFGAGGDRLAVLRSLVPVGGDQARDVGARLVGRLGLVAALVFIIACANAMHLLLARGLQRSRELATRRALGATGLQLARMLFVESVLLAALAGGAALVLGSWAGSALQRVIFPDSRWSTALADGRVLWFTVVAAIVAGVFAGAAPAVQAARSSLLTELRSGRDGAPRRTRTIRSALLVAQTALSTVLLIAACLVVASLLRLVAVDVGFAPERLISVSLPGSSFGLSTGPPALSATDLAARIATGDDPVEVGSSSTPLFGATKVVNTIVPGSTFTPADRDAPRINEIDPAVLSILPARLRWGRLFASEDVGTPVAVVNASMARNYWNGDPPPGACVLSMGSPCAVVVGVIDDIRTDPAESAPMQYYVPLDVRHVPAHALLLRAPEQVDAFVERLRSLVPPGQRVTIDRVSERLQQALRPWRAAAGLFAALGAIALALASVGMYSIVNHATAERSRELAIRVALGATTVDLRRLVLGSGLRWALIGGVVGLLVALAGGRLLSSLLFGVSPFDPRVYLLASATVVTAGVAAMLPVVSRASRREAFATLRGE